jgi:hypothetical protein
MRNVWALFRYIALLRPDIVRFGLDERRLQDMPGAGSMVQECALCGSTPRIRS